MTKEKSARLFVFIENSDPRVRQGNGRLTFPDINGNEVILRPRLDGGITFSVGITGTGFEIITSVGTFQVTSEVFRDVRRVMGLPAEML